jgi:hypothetical protein
MASCLIEWSRLRQKMRKSSELGIEEKSRIKKRLDAIASFIESDL